MYDRHPVRRVLWTLLLAGLSLSWATSGQAEQAPAAAGPPEVTLVIGNVRALTWAPVPGSIWPRPEVTVTPVDIAVAGERIAAIGPGLAARYPQARLVDGHGGYAIPGLIDVHVHAGSTEVGANLWSVLLDSFTMGRVKGAHALDAGVTTLRSVGDAFPGVDRMHRSWESDPARMPRLEFVGPMFTAPGGHPVSTIFRGLPWLYLATTRQVTSAEEAASEARRVLHGSDPAPTTLKAIYTTADGHLPRLPDEALRALVQQAAGEGAVVIAHTDSADDVMGAVEAGVWGVEHGVTTGDRLTPAQARRLAEAGVFYSPTLAVVEQMLPSVLPAALDNVRTVYEAGVPVVTGTDAGIPGVLYGLSVLREVELLHAAGLPASHALAAATYQAARYLRAQDRLGSLQPGFLADVVVVAGNPLEDLSHLREVRLVVRSGQVARLTATGRADGRWRLEPFVGTDGLVVGAALTRRTDGPVKLRADVGYAMLDRRVAYRLRADLGWSLATAGYVQVGDWPGSAVLGREGQRGLTAGTVPVHSRDFRLQIGAGLAQLWPLPQESASPSVAYGRALATHRWLFDERRLGLASVEAVVGAARAPAGGDATFGSLVLGLSVELRGLRTVLKAGLSQTWGTGLPGFQFSLGGPYGPARLRGFEPGAVSGSRMAWLTTDYRWTPVPAVPLQLHLFADAAAAWSPPAVPDRAAWRASAGIGVSVSVGPSAAYRLDVAVTPTGVAPVFWFQFGF